MVGVATSSGTSASDYHWDNNTYFGPTPGALFSWNGKGLNFSQWRDATGFDRSSSFTANSPSGVKVVVRPNRYEKGRANIAIYNWDHKASVSVDVSQVLQAGDAYELRDVQDLFGAPVLAGKYSGGPLQVPMTPGKMMRSPAGGSAPPSTLPEFGAFLLTSPMGERLSGQSSDGQTSSSNSAPPPSQASGLQAYVGEYTAKPNYRVVVMLQGDHLAARMMHEPGQPSYTLEPSGPDRFHFSGFPSFFYLQFDMSGGTPKAITIYRAPLPTVRLTRSQ